MPIIPVFTGGAALLSARINMFVVLSVTHLKVCAVVTQVNPSRADRWSVHGRKCSANSNHHDVGRTEVTRRVETWQHLLVNNTHSFSS